jgi:HEAT repeat protein
VNDQTPNIWQLQIKADAPGLIAALDHDDPSIRKRAAAALRTLGATQAIGALETRLRTEQEPEVRMTISSALEALLIEQGPVRLRETRRLVAQLKGDDPAASIKAARELAVLKDKTAVEALVITFHNSRLASDVRLAAAEALIALESAPALVTLLVALRRPDWTTRRSAAAVLGQLRADWAVGALAKCLKDDHEAVRRTARAALKRIATPQAIQALAEDDLAALAQPRRAQTAPLPATEPQAAPGATASPDDSLTQKP